MQSELSYALGLLLANNLAAQVDKADINNDDFMKGFTAVFQGQELAFDLQQASVIADKYIRENMQKKAVAAIQEEENFLAENAKKEGIISLASGLQYEVLVQGNGKIPRATNKVQAHYEGRLLDGKIFDSSYKRGQAATFPVNGLIQGWQEALQLMPVGSKWRLYIPSKLGYGPKGAGADIPGNATLIFDLELLAIV